MQRYIYLLLLLFSCVTDNNIKHNCYYNYHIPVEPVSNIWKITKPGYPDSYIIGSFHLGKKGSKLPYKIKNLIKRSNTIVTEVPLDIFPQGLEKGKYKEYLSSAKDLISGKKLYDKIGQDLFDKINLLIKQHSKAGQLIPQITFIEPWFLITLLDIYLFNNLDYVKSIDYLLVQDAILQKKKLDYLENMMDVQRIYSSIPLKYILVELNRYIEYDNIIQEELQKSYELYTKGKYKELLDVQFEEGNSLMYSSKADEYFWNCFYTDELVYKRNQLWTNKILDLLKKDKTIIVVGLLHLFTPRGLIKILQDNGFQLTPVK